MWICKECGCAKFKITKIEETEREVVFDKTELKMKAKRYILIPEKH